MIDTQKLFFFKKKMHDERLVLSFLSSIIIIIIESRKKIETQKLLFNNIMCTYALDYAIIASIENTYNIC